MTEKKGVIRPAISCLCQGNWLEKLTGVSDTALPRVEQAETRRGIGRPGSFGSPWTG